MWADMKIIFLSLFLLSGCFLDYEYQEENQVSKDPQYYEADFKNDISVQSFDDTLYYVYKSVEYKDETFDYWQTPEQTYTLKNGDCEDFAIFTMWILWNKLKIDSRLILIFKNGQGHAVIKVNGEYYDPRKPQFSYQFLKYVPLDLSTWTILHDFSYDETMHQAYFHHGIERKFN